MASRTDTGAAAAPRARSWHGAAIALAAVAVVLLVGFPLAELVATAFAQGAGPLRAVLTGDRALSAVRNTLLTGVVVTGFALVGGTAAALVTERSRAPGRAWLRVGLLVQLVIASFVGALGWAQAYGPGGLTDDLLGFALPGLYGVAGVVTVLSVQGVTLAYVVVAAGLASRVEPDLERAARASGASAWSALRTITLPLLRPTLLAAAALSFVSTVNAFGVPAVLGSPAGFVTVTTRIYSDLILSADPAAFSRVILLASGLVLLTLVVVGAVDLGESVRGAVTRTSAPPGGVPPGVGGRVAAGLLWGYVVLTTVVPLVALVLTALTRAVGLPAVPANWTLRHFREALTGLGGQALGRSVLLALAAATIVVGLGGLLTALRRRVAGRGLSTLATLPFAVPGSALAVGVLLAYGRWLRDTLLLILIAYLAKFWALGHRPIAGAADGQPPDLALAARASGAGPVTALRTVTLPLLRPALAAAWLLVFLAGFDELTMSSLLYGPGSETLAVVILNLQQLGDISVTTALAVILTGVVIAAAALLTVVRRATLVSVWGPSLRDGHKRRLGESLRGLRDSRLR
ncbi:MAG: ABC transporter permease [Egibacteraceae bacterium]